jgi:osmoprotectant transport system ATP-binding protein
MDEPFGAVDPIARDQLQLELLKLQERLHKTIVFVTHDMQEAFRLGTRILVMRKGKVVKIGKPLALIQEQDTFIQDFIGRKAIFDVMDTISVMDVLDRQVPIVNIETNQINNCQKSRCEYYLVINKIGEFLGVIEESCLPVAGNFKPEDIVAFDSYIDNKASVRNAIEKMLWSGHCYLPVLNDNILVGVITFDKCARLMQK